MTDGDAIFGFFPESKCIWGETRNSCHLVSPVTTVRQVLQREGIGLDELLTMACTLTPILWPFNVREEYYASHAW